MRDTASFAGGCFWGIEAAFSGTKGVTATMVGYTGGSLKDPTYEDVCSGTTGHAEAVQVEYDPRQVSYDELLKVFWSSHDPTRASRPAADATYRYRSAIFFHDPRQEAAAIASKASLESGSGKRVVTEISPTSPFYRAEERHQRYFEKHGHV